MQSRWTYVVTGLMAGVIAVLITMVMGQNRESVAWAAPQGVDNTGGGLMMGTGGSQTQTQDILWIIYKRAAPPASDAKGIMAQKTERITLCCYQVANGARQIKLVAVRDVSFDMDVVEYGNDKPHVKDIIDELRKNEKK
jgi:hypothetical protein